MKTSQNNATIRCPLAGRLSLAWCLLVAFDLAALLWSSLPAESATQPPAVSLPPETAEPQTATQRPLDRPGPEGHLPADSRVPADDDSQRSNTTVLEERSNSTVLEGRQDVDEKDQRFEAVDIYVDSAAEKLAAYQVEMSSSAEGVEIVGIEGGDHPAFNEPPHYDPRAMNGNRVILAAFHTGDQLPTGKSRVARVHVQLQGPHDHAWSLQLVASADGQGRRIPASLSIERASRK